MAKKILILIEDDWELQGNGLGNVAHLQYLPTLFLLEVADQLGIKLTFMAEVMQQLKHREYEHRSRNIRIQAEIWDQTVLMVHERGHDVQLHLHPQWLNATFDGARFKAAGNWNIATYPRADRQRMIAESTAYLSGLISPIDADYSVNSFKAGQWGLQPSEGLLQDMEEAGLRIIMGVGKGINYRTAEFAADYTGLEEDLLPYYPVYSDIRRVSASKESVVVLPLPYYTVGPGMLARQVFQRATRRAQAADKRLFYFAGLSATDAAHSPMGPRRVDPRAILARRGDLRSLDIGSASFEELRLAIDQIIGRASEAEPDTVPVVLQSHTKAYNNNWEDLGLFFRYLVDTHGRSIQFMTLSEFNRTLPSIFVRGGP